MFTPAGNLILCAALEARGFSIGPSADSVGANWCATRPDYASGSVVRVQWMTEGFPSVRIESRRLCVASVASVAEQFPEATFQIERLADIISRQSLAIRDLVGD